jgi:serine/threonine-protein kinase RsbW
MKAEFHAEARLENLERVREFVDGACRRAGAEGSFCFDLKSAVDEACTNIILHGYRDREPGPIDVCFEEDAERMVVTITDRGRSFAPSEIRAPDFSSSWRERPAGGLGWHLIGKMVDEVEYRVDGEKGNRLILVKRRSSPGRP